MKAIIIEDEKLSAEHLCNLIKRIDASIEVVEIFDSVKKSIASFQKGSKADVLFVDVHLADGLSFDIFSKISIDTPIIFTTAYDEYAIKAFKLNSVDYLLKPIGSEDLKVAIEKFKKTKNQHQINIIENITNAYQSINKQYKNRFMVKLGDNIISIKTEDIFFFIAEDGITLLVNSAGKRYAVDYTLDQLESLVSPELFFRINRKVLLAMNAVQKVNTYFNSRLKINSDLLDDESAVVSRERVSDFKAWLDK
ncbi:MAG: LytR/AlgR family response regulator transcription factor [Bacteroidota bacterium]|jgi:DNA-binding LytR/AlgR family response regulator